ncbi:uric acid degradation bifunctional protein TTL isoform X1 [Dioscorea cayenensis subsp. rotundata]|uniref:Uric acid degradation bifunctional protein TTL isoform X1 n=1 Tax=Dioscorea cayennensis subsp. rotundata TaxID=55577 RepID=A0AB40C6F5_DIOCR|nr:uric acid degradation bifunctional protein TTL isoform X1 [Dioscorea cayenensis subsp. rotundata]
MEEQRSWSEIDFLRCCGSSKFSRAMMEASPFPDLQHAIQFARNIWFNEIDVNGWLDAFADHPPIGATSKPISQWSKEEQSTAVVTATDSTMEELIEWNARYKEKFGFVFLICASGRSTPEILSELKKRYSNRLIVELEIAAQEEMKITELRMAKLFESKARAVPATSTRQSVDPVKKSEDRLGIIGAHLVAGSEAPEDKPLVHSGNPRRSRPPITTHVLDVARGCPGKGIEVQLEMWRNQQNYPSFKEQSSGNWSLLGSSVTDSDGRSGHLMNIIDDITPGIYRISFNTGKYNPSGFFPYISIVFEIKESQKSEHFHVPLLLSPFSVTTYRGS